MSPAKLRPFCLGLNVLIRANPIIRPVLTCSFKCMFSWPLTQCPKHLDLMQLCCEQDLKCGFCIRWMASKFFLLYINTNDLQHSPPSSQHTSSLSVLMGELLDFMKNFGPIYCMNWTAVYISGGDLRSYFVRSLSHVMIPSCQTARAWHSKVSRWNVWNDFNEVICLGFGSVRNQWHRKL